MRLFKEKLAWAAPIAVILIIALFSVNLFAQGNPQVRNLPVALVVNDEGNHVDAVKSAIEQMSSGTDGNEPTLAVSTENEADIEQLFHDKKYYAALVIPEGYNDTLQNAMTNNTAATLHVYMNQGFNMTGANFARTALNSLIAQLSNQYSTSFVDQMGDQKGWPGPIRLRSILFLLISISYYCMDRQTSHYVIHGRFAIRYGCSNDASRNASKLLRKLHSPMGAWRDSLQV